jgi:hypothetical protein
MTGMEIGLGSLVSAIRFLFDLVKEGSAASKARRRTWFEDHIKPSYEELLRIHENYRQQFQKAADDLRMNANLPAAVAILKQERPEKLLDRQAVRENLKALREYRLTKTRKPPLALAFYDYVHAVESYLGAASPLPHESWYGHFIKELSKLADRKGDAFGHDYPAIAQGREAPKIALRKLEEAVAKDMPDAMREVQAAYGQLRAQCLGDF